MHKGKMLEDERKNINFITSEVQIYEKLKFLTINSRIICSLTHPIAGCPRLPHSKQVSTKTVLPGAAGRASSPCGNLDSKRERRGEWEQAMCSQSLFQNRVI